MKNLKKLLFIAIILICLSDFLGEVNKPVNDQSITTNKNVKANMLLVNNNNKLDKNYSPKEITIPNIPFIDDSDEEEKQMEGIAARAVEDLFKVAKENDINFLATSAYRSYDSQNKIYKRKIMSSGIIEANKYVAKPGTSEHQTGLCIDVTNHDRWFVGITKEATWLAQNAHEFGFIIRYPKGKEDITGKSYEPWHIRYVGKAAAKEIYENNLTLEEYVANK